MFSNIKFNIWNHDQKCIVNLLILPLTGTDGEDKQDFNELGDKNRRKYKRHNSV